MTDAGETPFWAKCPACSHCWPIAYLPMNIAAVARSASRAECSKCGHPKPVVAKQSDGILQEIDPK